MKQVSKGNTTTIILALLKSEPMYGYQIVKEMNAAHLDVLQLNEGTIYPLLHSLERGGLVKGVWEKRQGNRQRKYYHLTPAGEKILSAKVSQWRSFSNALDGLLGSAS